MPNLPHRIRKQSWTVRAGSAAEAFAWRKLLHNQVSDLLLPVFERAFDELGACDEVVRIPRLSLELKLRPGEDFVPALTEVLKNKLNEALQDVVIAHPKQAGVQRLAMQASRHRTLLTYLASGQIEWHAQTQDAESLAQTLRTEAVLFAKESPALFAVISGSLVQRTAISFRLLHLLPSEARPVLLSLAPLHTAASLPDKPPATAVAAAALLPIVLQQLVSSGVLGCYLLLRVQALLLALRDEDILYPLEAHTLTLLHECLGQTEAHASTATLGAVLRVLTNPASGFETLTAAHPQNTSEAGELLDAISGTLAQRTAASFRLLQLLPSEARLAKLELAPLHSHASLPDKLPTAPDAAIALLPIVLRQLASSGMLGSDLLLRVQAMLLAIRPEDLRIPLEAHILTLLHECHEPIAHLTSTTALSAVIKVLTNSVRKARTSTGTSTSKESTFPDSIVPPVTRPSSNAPDASEGYPASDAGLVLLHPFLPRLFDAVGIAPAGTVALPEAMLPRAAAMLHWLTSGREEIYEFELTITKVLLGLAPDHMLLVSTGLLSEADRIEADALLTAAIAHWDALGNTGTAALRMSFLQRQGLLRDNGSGWQLQVEPESFDLLLGRLPWGISIVRLPWMTRPIFTEWPTP